MLEIDVKNKYFFIKEGNRIRILLDTKNVEGEVYSKDQNFFVLKLPDGSMAGYDSDKAIGIELIGSIDLQDVQPLPPQVSAERPSETAPDNNQRTAAQSSDDQYPAALPTDNQRSISQPSVSQPIISQSPANEKSNAPPHSEISIHTLDDAYINLLDKAKNNKVNKQLTPEKIKEYLRSFRINHPAYYAQLESTISSFFYTLGHSRIELDIQNRSNKTMPIINKLKSIYVGISGSEDELLRIIAYVYYKQTDNANHRLSCIKEGVEFLTAMGRKDLAIDYLRTYCELPYILEPWRSLIDVPEWLISAIDLSSFAQSKEHCLMLKRIVDEIDTSNAVSRPVMNMIFFALLIKLSSSSDALVKIGRMRPDAPYTTNELQNSLNVSLSRFTGRGYIMSCSNSHGKILQTAITGKWEIADFVKITSSPIQIGDYCEFSKSFDEDIVHLERIITPENMEIKNLNHLYSTLPESETKRYVNSVRSMLSKPISQQQNSAAYGYTAKTSVRTSAHPVSPMKGTKNSAQPTSDDLQFTRLLQNLSTTKTAEGLMRLVPAIQKYADMTGPHQYAAIKLLVDVYCRNVVRNYQKAVETIEKYGSYFDSVPSERASFQRLCISPFIGVQRYEDAIEYLIDLESIESMIANRVRLAYCYLMSGKHEDAIKVSDSVLNAWPTPNPSDLSPAYTYKFMALIEESAYDDALRLIDEFEKTTTNAVKISDMRILLQQRRDGSSINETTFVDDYYQSNMQSIVIDEVLTSNLKYLIDHLDYKEILNRTPDEVSNKTWKAVSCENAKKIIYNLMNRTNIIDIDNNIRSGALEQVTNTCLTIAGVSRISIDELDGEENEFFRSRLVHNAALMYWCKATHERMYGEAPLDTKQFYYFECIRLYSRLGYRFDIYQFYDALNTYITKETNIDDYTRINPFRATDIINERNDARRQIFNTIKRAIEEDRVLTAKVIVKLLLYCKPLEGFILNTDYLREAGIDIMSCLRSISYKLTEDSASPQTLLESHYRNLRDYRQRITEAVNSLCAEMTYSKNMARLQTFVGNFESIVESDTNLYLSSRDKEECNRIILLLKSYCELIQYDNELKMAKCADINSKAIACVNDIKKSPTSFSFGSLVALAIRVGEAAMRYSDEIVKASIPIITVSNEREAYAPLNHVISLQLRIKNAEGCTPAHQVILHLDKDDNKLEDYVRIQEDDNQFEFKLDKPIRGGNEEILQIELPLTTNGEKPDTDFELGYYLSHTTIQNEPGDDLFDSISIHIMDGDNFNNIESLYNDQPLNPNDNTREYFFGRSDEIDGICNALLDRDRPGQTFILYGQFRAGKTTLFNFITDTLSKKDSNIIVAKSQDVKTDWTFATTTKNFVTNICDAIKDKGYNIDDDLLSYYHDEFTISNYSIKFPGFVKALRKYLDAQENKLRIVLTADEFGRAIKGDKSLEFFETWKEIMEIRAIDAIFIGHDVITQMIHKHTNPFGTTQLHLVNHIHRDAMVELITKPTEYVDSNGEYQARFKNEVVNRIAYLTNGNVLFIQMICQKLISFMNEKRINRVNSKDFDECMQSWVDVDTDSTMWVKNTHGLYDAGETGEDKIKNEENICVLNTIALYNQKYGYSFNKAQETVKDDLIPRITNIYGKLFTSYRRVEAVITSLYDRKVIDIDNATRRYYVRVRFYEEYLLPIFRHKVRQYQTGEDSFNV